MRCWGCSAIVMVKDVKPEEGETAASIEVLCSRCGRIYFVQTKLLGIRARKEEQAKEA